MGRRVRCANPICTRTLLKEVRVGNKSGRSEYCSKACFSIWNPTIRQVADKLGASDPVEFRDHLEKVVKSLGERVTESVLQVSHKQLRRWLETLPKERPKPLV